MNYQDERLTRIRAVKARYEFTLLRKANVVGVGIGLRRCNDVDINETVLIVNVTHKVPPEDLAPEDRIPREIEGVAVDVQPIGYLKAHE